MADELPTSNRGLYDTNYQADFNTAYIRSMATMLDLTVDENIYSGGFERTLSARGGLEKEDFHVVELGTGDGRTLRTLAQQCIESGSDHAKSTHFIGVDRSRAQLKLAASELLAGPATVRWEIGHADTFASIPALNHLHSAIDYMILFDTGSICHLSGSDEARAMFEQVALLLRPQAGRAFITLQNDNVLSRSITKGKPVPAWWDTDLREEQELESTRYPGIRYRLAAMSPPSREGMLVSFTTSLTVLKTSSDTGLDEVITQDPISISQLEWHEKDFVACVESAKLKITNTYEGPWQTYYELMRQ